MSSKTAHSNRSPVRNEGPLYALPIRRDPPRPPSIRPGGLANTGRRMSHLSESTIERPRGRTAGGTSIMSGRAGSINSAREIVAEPHPAVSITYQLVLITGYTTFHQRLQGFLHSTRCYGRRANVGSARHRTSGTKGRIHARTSLCPVLGAHPPSSCSDHISACLDQHSEFLRLVIHRLTE